MDDPAVRLNLLLQAAATLYMTGLIWFVQVVHYPLMGAVHGDFADYERRHKSLTTWVVAPPMLVEGATALLLFWLRPDGSAAWQLWTGIALVFVNGASTAFVQVPCHVALSEGFRHATHQRLVRTNWIRTIAWTLRAILVLWVVSIAAA